MNAGMSTPAQPDAAVVDPTMRIPEPGEHIGKYVVLAPLGSGAMGVVVRAYDPDLERSVAIKVVRPRNVDAEHAEAARGRLLAEARALARVSHPNVLAVYEVGLHGGLIFVAMELVDGVDLEHWLRARKRSWREIVDAFESAGRGLAQVHAAGLVHRDVKPANILVGDDGRVRVGDFGIARACFELPAPVLDGYELDTDAFDLDTTALTAEGRVVGTPAYMAPEQHLGEQVGPAADQYALCVALYEALWGKRPFAVDPRRLLAAKRQGPRPPPPGSRVPKWLAAIVMRGLAPEPGARFASMTELCAALRADPSARRRRRIAVAVGGAVTIGAFVLTARLVARPGPCDDDEIALHGAWDAASRAAVAQVFAASDRPWAATAWEHASPQLDDYAAQWTAMRRDACEATHVRGEQSAALLDRRMACLETRRRGLGAVTELLAAGESSAVDHTFELLGRLRPLAPCADAIALASAIELPDDPTLRAAVEAQRNELARARVLIDAGRIVDAVALAEAAVTAARELDYPPLLAETLALAGETSLRVGKADEARVTLESSLWLAIAAAHDEVAADAASNLVWVAGQHQHSLPEALRWSELAHASLRRGSRDGVRELVQLENAVGAAYEDAAHYEEAEQTFERALARIADDPAMLIRVATLRNNLAKHWVDRGELGRARAILEPTLAQLAVALGDEHPRVVAVRGTLAQVLGASGDHAAAIELFRGEVESLTRALGDDSLAVANARVNLGVALSDVGRDDEAFAVTELALAAFERLGEAGHASTCLSNLGSSLYKRKIYDAAEQRFARAVELLEGAYPDGHPSMVEPLVGIGRVRAAQGRFDEALASYERADRLLLAAHSSSAHTRGLVLEGKGTALTMLGRSSDALVVIAEEIEMMRGGGDIEPDELALALRHHAYVLQGMARFDEALPEIDEALGLLRAAGMQHAVASTELERARALHELRRDGEAQAAAAAGLAIAEQATPRDDALVAEARSTVATLAQGR
jgi:eukaryotic-like serine/threonine-protein kinase